MQIDFECHCHRHLRGGPVAPAYLLPTTTHTLAAAASFLGDERARVHTRIPQWHGI